MTQNLEQKVIQDYLSKTMFIKDICKKYQISNYIFNKILKKNNIQKYDSHFLYPQNQRKYFIKEDFFDKETPEMAYILGFLAADGTVRKNNNEVKLTLSSVDKEILEKFYNMVGGRPIKTYTDSKGYENSTWTFSSQHIKQQLAYYNIISQKTFCFSFPQHLKKEFWIDFIRGYFDGDGSVSTAGPRAIRCTLCSASKNVLEVITTFLEEEYGITAPSIREEKRKHPLYIVQYSSVSTRKFFDTIYYPNCLCLKRKKEKFEQIYNINLKK